MTKILIPTPLRPYTDKQDAVDAAGATVGELLTDLTTKHAGLKAHLYNEQGKLRSFVNIYVNDEDIRYLQKEQTVVKANDTVSIIPSVAGGTGSEVVSTAVPPETTPDPGPPLPELTNEEIKRYSRHLIMPEVGVEAQRKLKASKVLCIGAGGLGSPAAMYLAAAGVGTLGIVDFDTVDFSNLQRQILHGTPDVGRSKLASARDRLNAINPNVKIETYETALSSENALELFAPYDVILDGTDNFPTRYLVNDACVLTGKPNVYGSIFRFDGQASVFFAEKGPCYRCLYPEPPPPNLVPSCAEGGVLGVLPGVIGTIQATETIKLITGVGEPLIGRLLLFDALRMEFRPLRLKKDPNCAMCGPKPTITHLIDYEGFCNPVQTTDVTPAELAAMMKEIDLIDIREQQEWNQGYIEGARLVPLSQLHNNLELIPRDRDVVLYCRSGSRSAHALEMLRAAGYHRAKHLKGGILAWQREGR
jgi:molybdopterin/thiamine biosynthesis adenylyltransferase/rhodanese-related sulfurtransferase/molybdopterin converting factor small subunit